jgi:hypothetical protein
VVFERGSVATAIVDNRVDDRDVERGRSGQACVRWHMIRAVPAASQTDSDTGRPRADCVMPAY